MINEKTPIGKSKYELIWRDFPAYRNCSPGDEFVAFFFDGFKGDMRPGQTIINFGCGTARVAKTFLSKGLNISLVDISPYALDEDIRNLLILFSNQMQFYQACLWQLPKQLKSAYWSYCCHVLEYISEDHLDLVLRQMEERMRFGGYFSICLEGALSSKRPLQPLPVTVKSKAWWEKKLSKYFNIIGEDVMPDNFYFNCRVLKK